MNITDHKSEARSADAAVASTCPARVSYMQGQTRLLARLSLVGVFCCIQALPLGTSIANIDSAALRTAHIGGGADAALASLNPLQFTPDATVTSMSADSWSATTPTEAYTAIVAAIQLLDEPAVRASAMFTPAANSTYGRDRLDLFDLVLSGSPPAPILPR